MELDHLIIFLTFATSMVVLFILYKKMKDGFGSFNLRAVGITLISTMVAFLTLSNIESSKLAPAYGILGAIAGYLFGQRQESKNSKNSKNNIESK